MELNSAGNALVYSTYLGGSKFEYTVGIAVDFNGNALVAGTTLSTDFPLQNAYQSTPGGPFVASIEPGGSKLAYSTYYGGAGFSNGLTVDSMGDAIVYGDTADTSFPVTTNAYQPNFCGYVPGQPVANSHGWLAELTPAGVPNFSTYICGSAAADAVRGAAVDSAGNVTITGNTTSTTFPTTTNAIQAQNAGGMDAFVTQLNAAGTTLVYSTYLGGNGADEAYGVALDALGNAYITGKTASSNFPAVNPTQSQLGGGTDAFLTKINPAGSDIVFSTWIGGSGTDSASAVAVDSLAKAYVTGTTASANFPTVSPLQPNYGGGSSNAFLTVISTCSIALSAPGAFGPGGGAGSTSVTTTAECGWTAVSNSSWIAISSSPPSGSGTGSVSWSVAQNTGSQRTGTLTIGGQTVTITQSGPAAPVITWSAPAAIVYGTALSATQLNASSTVAGNFVYTPAAGAVLGAGNRRRFRSPSLQPTASTTLRSPPPPP